MLRRRYGVCRPDSERRGTRTGHPLGEVTMVRWKRTQRSLFANKLPDTANLALGALVFGQVLGDRFSPFVAVTGVAVWALFMGWAAYFAGGAE